MYFACIVLFKGESESSSEKLLTCRSIKYLKVLTNEKSGGLKDVAFDKSPFKLFTWRISTKSVQAPSCKRPETIPSEPCFCHLK
jgi:hypothetical protein